MITKYDLAPAARTNAEVYRDYLRRHPDQETISLTRGQLEAICRGLAAYADRDEDARGWAQQATANAAEIARLRESLAVISETIKRERETMNDLFDCEPWIGFATPLASIARIEAALGVQETPQNATYASQGCVGGDIGNGQPERTVEDRSGAVDAKEAACDER